MMFRMSNRALLALAPLVLSVYMGPVANAELKSDTAGLAGSPSHVEVSSAGEQTPASSAMRPASRALLEDVRSLYRLQDASAQGEAGAVELQKELLQALSRGLLEAQAGSDPNELALATAGFVLSGGNPAHAELLIARDGLNMRNRRLLAGSALYMRGKREEAATELRELQLNALPGTIGGRIALVRAMLEEDKAERQMLLAQAIALMPGTLVEESALRRSALLYAAEGRQKQAWSRTDRYLRRFPHSLYAPEFLAQLVSHVVQFEKSGGGVDRARLTRILDKVPVPARRNLLIDLARGSAAANLGDLCAFAGGSLLGISNTGSTVQQIATLYTMLFKVASPDLDSATAELDNIDPGLLPDLERKLLQASRDISHSIMAPAKVEAGDANAAPAPSDMLAIESSGKIALEKADSVLASARQP